MSEILRVENLSYTYSSGTPFEKHALDNVSLTIHAGETLGIIGHTGSGKSTLMSHFNGLLKPTTGKVFLSGQDIWLDGRLLAGVRFKVGLVFQYPEYQLFEETVFKDICFGPKNMRLSEDEITKRAHEAMEFVGLDQSIGSKSPFELSGGQKRRVAIAGVVAMNPEVLILDEPTAGLDPLGKKEVLGHIMSYQKSQNRTVILVSHSMEDIANIADRIIVMNHGQILLDDTSKNVFSCPQELIYAGLNVPQITQVFLELNRRGIEIDTSVYTVNMAIAEIQRIKRRER